MNQLPLTVASLPLIHPDQLTAPAQALYARLDVRAQSREIQAAVDAGESVTTEIMNAGLAIVGGDGYPAKRESPSTRSGPLAWTRSASRCDCRTRRTRRRKNRRWPSSTARGRT